MRKAGLTNCGVEVVVHLTGVFGTHPPPVQLYHRKKRDKGPCLELFLGCLVYETGAETACKRQESRPLMLQKKPNEAGQD